MNILIGILLISIILLGSYFAFYFAEKKTKYSILIILLIGFILRLFISFYPNLHKWDERFHALSAKNISTQNLYPKLYLEHNINYDNKNWMIEKEWIHKPPFLLYIIKCSLSLFGNNAFSVRIPSLVASTLTILLVFLIACNLFQNTTIALISSYLCSVNGLLLDFSGGVMPTDHYDTFLLFFFCCSIYFFTKEYVLNIKNLIIGTVFLFLAFQTKLFTALFAYYILFFILHFLNKSSLIKSIKYTAISCLIFILLNLFSLYLIYSYTGYAFIKSMYELFAHINETYDQGGPWYFYINKIRENYGEFIYLVLLYYIYHTYTSINKSKYLLIGSWFLLPILILSFAKTKMPGYIIISVPSIFIIYGIVISEFKKYTFRFKNLVLFIVLFVIPLRYCMERVKPFTDYISMYKDHNTYINKISKLNKDDIVVNDSRSIETMFFSNATSYEYLSTKDIDVLKKKHFKIYYFDGDILKKY
jgi:4-amino-4-deoxy-L-arabinose transferase-like glycosyltransferase